MSANVKNEGHRGNFYVDRRPGKPQPKRQVSLPHISVPTGKLKKVILLTVLLFAVVVVALGIGHFFVWIYDTAVTSSLFVTQTIEVYGNTRLPRELVLSYANIHEGQNSLAVNIASVEQNLRRTPWVESVSVKRLLPDKFVIRIRERMPSFWVQRDGVLYYATEEGDCIAPVESKNFLSLPALSIETGAESLKPYLVKFRESVRTGDLPFDMSSVSQISLSLTNGLEIFLEDRDLWLSFDPGDWDRNVVRVKRVFTDLVKRREMKNVREMRVIEGNVWVILNQSVKNLPNAE